LKISRFPTTGFSPGFVLDLVDEIFDKPFAYTKEDFHSLGEARVYPLEALGAWA